MKVTMVNAEWLPVPPVLGGAVEETVFETAKAISDPELTVISPWVEALEDVGDRPSNVFYHVDIHAEIAKVREIFGDRMPPGMRRQKVAGYFGYLNGVTELLLEINPDVIQVHNRAEFVPYLVKQFPEKRMVLYLHNEPRYSDVRLAETVQDIDHLVFVSEFLARRFASRFPGCESRSEVIYNSVDTTKWRPGLGGDRETENVRREYGLSAGRTVLFVGRTVYHKGLSFLLEAVDVARRRLPGTKLLVVGSPLFGAVKRNRFLKGIEERASEMGDAVSFTGYVDHDRTPYFYAAADVVVVPSVWGEPFGKVVTESMAAGVPVIGSRRGAIPEIVEDGVEGVLVDDPGDVEALAHHIVEMLEDAEKRREMGIAARRKAVAHFATPVRLARVRAFYGSLGAQRRR